MLEEGGLEGERERERERERTIYGPFSGPICFYVWLV